MQPHRPRHSRQPAQVYRVRRAVAATLALLVLFAVAKLLGFGGGGDTADAVTTTTAESTTTTIPPPPACAEGDVPVDQDPDTAWQTILVDTSRAIPSGYNPPDLHNIADAGFPLTDGVAVRSLALADLTALRQAAAANGTPISVIAAYRSYPHQADLYARRTDELGASEAGSRVARPGHSEHQLGTTIDVTSQGLTDVDQSWGATPTGQWIATNAYRYGFILSYPQDAQARTCYDYEPWHLRYVGPEMAARVIESGLTLREYLWQLDPHEPSAAAASTTTTISTVPADG
jgi:D-alanyl-D-alanine carboxypeptidase